MKANPFHGEQIDAPPRYAAPALEKGLELLEALAAEPGGMTQTALANCVGRSVPEIYRMLNVLERYQYVSRDPTTAQYSLTLKLFQLATLHPPTRRLLHSALPVMRQLAERTGQSCHLVVAQGDRILIVADEQSSLPMAFSVRLGASFPMSPHYVSARVLAAFQPEPRREELARRMIKMHGGKELASLQERLDWIVRMGHDQAPSKQVQGIIDISYPVLDHLRTAVAALSIPYLATRDARLDEHGVVTALASAAAEISRNIGCSAGK